jgi:hypothetical protein
MSDVTITHTFAEGTLLDGTTKGDGVADILQAQQCGWRWSRNLGMFYQRSTRDRLARRQDLERTKAALEQAGHSVTLQIDNTPRPVEDREVDRGQRMDARAEALHAKAARHANAAEAFRGRERAISEHLTGEPIKVGHHSERRHRRDLDRVHNLVGKAIAADKQAAQYGQRAATAEVHMGARENPMTVARRIVRLETDLRGLEKRLPGAAQDSDLHAEATNLRMQVAHWAAVRALQIEEGRASDFGKHNLAKGNWVRVRGQWRQVVRTNRATVTLTTGYSWTDTAPYFEITAARESLDRDECVRVAAPDLAPEMLIDTGNLGLVELVTFLERIPAEGEKPEQYSWRVLAWGYPNGTILKFGNTEAGHRRV